MKINPILTLDKLKGILVVFHPTSFCNLDCSYCWAPDRNVHKVLSLEIVHEVARKVYSLPSLEEITFCWHSGEPFVPGLEYYQEVITILRRLKPDHIKVKLNIQTNGTLINDDWAMFLKENDFTVGVSIDGPEHIHNFSRFNRNKKGSHHLTIKGIELLKKYQIDFGAICVITKNTLKHTPKELFDFFRLNQIRWSYLVEARIGSNTYSDNAFNSSDKVILREYLSQLLELWGQYPECYIRDFDYISEKLFDTNRDVFDYINQACLNIISITADGDFFFGNPELLPATNVDLANVKGNIFIDDLISFMEKKELVVFQSSIIKGLKSCMDNCDYFIGCRGGNPSHKFYEHKTFEATTHLSCELNQKNVIDLIFEKIENN